MRALLALAAACAACTTPSSSKSAAVYPTDTTRFDMTVSGGLQPAPAAGSTCTPGSGDSFTYVLAERTLSWTTCSDVNGDLVFAKTSGQNTLAPANADALVATFRALAPPVETCGSDVTMSFAFTTPQRVETYPDAICLVGQSDVVDAVYAAAQ